MQLIPRNGYESPLVSISILDSNENKSDRMSPIV